MQLHPENMRKLDIFLFLAIADMQNCNGDFLHNFIVQINTWYEMLNTVKTSDGALNESNYFRDNV